MGDRDLSENAPKGNWSKAIYDGQKIVTFRSVIPKKYNRRAPKLGKGASATSRMERELNYDGAEGPLTWMLFKSPKLLDGLIDTTFLRRFDVTPDSELSKITIGETIETPQDKSLNGGKPVERTLELWIEPKTLTLQKSRQFDSFKGEIIENYTEQRFNPSFPKGLFRAAAPVGYTIIQDEN